jgi:hypothetical protein
MKKPKVYTRQYLVANNANSLLVELKSSLPFSAKEGASQLEKKYKGAKAVYLGE